MGGGESSCTISGTPHHPISFVLALRAFALSGTPKSKEKRKKKGSPSPFPPCSSPPLSPPTPAVDLVGLNVLGAKHALHLSKAGWVRTDGTVGNCLTTEALLASSHALDVNRSGSRGLQVGVEVDDCIGAGEGVSGPTYCQGQEVPLEVLAC